MATPELDKDLLDILACPETKEPVKLVDDELLTRLNKAIEAGQVTSMDGSKIERPFDGALVRQDGKVLYPVRGGIPIMLIDEAVQVESIPS